MKIGNTTLIPQNVAPYNARKAVITDKNGNVICEMDLGHWKMPYVGTKLYSVGIISDTHIYGEGETSYKADDTSASEDLERVLVFLRDNVDFTCVVGDLSSWGTKAGLAKYKQIIDTNKGNMPVYAIAGNHEYWASYYKQDDVPGDIPSVISDYTGYPLYYTIEYEGDVFIFSGATAIEGEFTTAKKEWLEGVLENYKDKRCFLIMHCFLFGSEYCGDSTGIINTRDMIGDDKTWFINLLRQYPNVIYIHGHSHTMFEMQEYTQKLSPPLPANYDFSCGVHSIHTPSTTMPRDISSGSREEEYHKSEGYIMDVYENHIVLCGIDFVSGEQIPISTYCLETT